MAKRRSRKTSARRRGGTARRSGGALASGAIGGVAASLGASMLGPQFGPAAGLAAAGSFRRDSVLMTMAGVALGSKLAPTLQGALGVGGGNSTMPGSVL